MTADSREAVVFHLKHQLILDDAEIEKTTTGIDLQKIFRFRAEQVVQKPVELGLGVNFEPCLIAPPRLVDWFAFWLNGEQDLEPGKAEQYSRWRQIQRETSPSKSTREAADIQ